MVATLLSLSIETPETSVSCANCSAVQRLERALEELRADFRREVAYWKSRHADAVKRIEQLKEELEQSRGQTRALQDKLFGRKSEKSVQGDRSNDLFDPEARRGGVCPVAGSDAGVSDLREADRRDVGHGRLGRAGDRRAGASSPDSAETVSGDLRL